MRLRVRPFAACLLVIPLMLAASMPSAHAIHWFRGAGNDPNLPCTPADGALPSPPVTQGPPGATAQLGHNTFNTTLTGFDVLPAAIHVEVGESVTWTWNSAHCHSVTSNIKGLFDSGFHYPTMAPESQQVAPGFFEYPVLDATPTLRFTHTFNTVGSFEYFCVHHASIGMIGTVIVNPAP